jgi:hypothetical protein
MTPSATAHHSEKVSNFDIAICDFNNRARWSPIASLSGYVGQASRLTSNHLRPQARRPRYDAEAMSRAHNPDKFPEGDFFEHTKMEKTELVENFHRFEKLKHATVRPNTVIFARKREGHRRPACVKRMAPWFQGSRCVKDRQSPHGRDGHAPFFRPTILPAMGEVCALNSEAS